MKHIVRKPFKQWTLDAASADALANGGTDTLNQTITPEIANRLVGYVQTLDNKLVQTFPFIKNGIVHQVVEPHPVTLYFNGAQFFLKHVNERKELLNKEI